MGPVGCVPFYVEDNVDQVYLVPSNFRNCVSFFSLGNVESRPDLLAKLKGRRKEEYRR